MDNIDNKKVIVGVLDNSCYGFSIPTSPVDSEYLDFILLPYVGKKVMITIEEVE
jgi:hypothetical protein